MKKRLATTLLGAVGLMLSASAQVPAVLPLGKAQATTKAAADLIDYINLTHPDALRAKGLTPQQADQAAAAARNFAHRAPAKAAYTGPGANQEFLFTLPEGPKLGYMRGLYYCTGGDGSIVLKAEDATSNMSGRYNGALIDGWLHTLSGDLSWSEYGLVICRDHVYDAASNWQLYKSVSLNDYPYLISQEVAVDPLTHRVYGTFLRSDYETYDIAWVNYDTYEIHRIGTAQRDYPGLGMNSEGRLFGVDMDGILYEISLTDGTDHAIGSTGLVVRDEDDRYFMQSAECGVSDNVLYWAATFPDGTSALYAIDLTTAAATKIHDFPKYTLIHCLTVPDTMANDDAPAIVNDLKAQLNGAETTGSLVFTLPVTTYKGQALSGTLDYEVRIDGIQQNTGNGEAGAVVTLPLSLEEGLHFVEVYASNAAGRSAQASARVFAGLDKPGEVQNPQLKLTDGQAVISWEPAKGANGGYCGDLVYSVRRNTDNKIVASKINALSYTETAPTGNYRQVSYSIVPVGSAANGTVANTRSIAMGTPYAVPYAEDFLTESDFQNNYTVYDANGDDVTWITNITTNGTYAIYTFNISSMWTNQPANDWLFTPAFALKGGHTYTLTFREGCSGSDTQCINKLEVKLGKGADADAMTTELLPVREFKNNQYFNDVAITFTAPDDDAYNVGFHVVSDRRKSDFILDLIQLEETTTDASPAAVSNLKLTPGAQGARQATISFTAPSATLGGAAIGSLENIRVIRSNKVLHTFNNPTPGEQLSFVDTTAPNGYNTYTVVATGSTGDGPVAQVTGYVGIDIPSFDYTSVGVEDNFDHITVTWSPVGTTGLNGAYVDPSAVYYYVYGVDYDVTSGSMTMGDYIGYALATDHLDIAQPTDTGEQQVVSYAIVAGNEVGADEYHAGATYGLPIGQPYALPFIQSASNSKVGNRMMWAETENVASATYGFSQDSYDKDNGSFEWAPSSAEYTLSLNTGKISLAGSNSPKLMFAHKAEPRSRFQLAVKIQTPDREETVIQEINYQTITGTSASWKLETLDLSDYRNEDYVIVKFRLSSNATANSQISDKSILIDAINVIDMQRYNLSIDIDAPEQIVAGRGDEIGVVVHNVGERIAAGYDVKLYVDDEEIYASTIAEPLPSLGRKAVTVDYNPSVFSDATHATLRAELSWPYDLVEEDNEMEAVLNIVAPTVGKPQNALSSAIAGGVSLSWSAPEQVVEQTTESFEGREYTDFDLCGIDTLHHEGMMGDWTVWNLDRDGYWKNRTGIPTLMLPNYDGSELDGVTFPNMRQVCAWMVFNNDAVVGEMPIKPRTGKKMAATFSDYVYQDTWLISPELSGNAQIVEFYAAAPATTNWLTGEPDEFELIEVLYSTKGLNVDDFVSLDTDSITTRDWLDFAVSLPAGARYFAIRDISEDYNALAMFVDDVTYERMSPLPASYNIYADEQLLRNVTLGEPLTVDGQASAYAVTAVYANGDESLPVFFTDQPDGITELQGDATTGRQAVYDLQGRKVATQLSPLGTHLKKGLYIINGKTVILR